MPVLLKSGLSASREEAVEEMKDCRGDEGLSIDGAKTLFMYFFKPLLTATLSYIHSSRLGEKKATPSESSWNSIDFGFIVYICWGKILNLQPLAGHRPLDPRWKEPWFPGSPLKGTQVPRNRVFRVRSQDHPFPREMENF